MFKVTPETEAKLEVDVQREPPIPTPPTTVKAPVDVDVDAVLYKTETAVPVICMESVAPELYTNLKIFAVVEPKTKSPEVEVKYTALGRLKLPEPVYPLEFIPIAP